jgi:DNA-binding GntR family transcriptional regulator
MAVGLGGPCTPTVQQAVLDRLRVALLRGRLRPGDPIRVDQIAVRLGVSSGPVREALRVLLAEGRVAYEPHRGYRVTRLTSEDVEEIFLICGLLEAEALRRGVRAMASDDVARMDVLLNKLQRLPAGEDIWNVVSIHRDFHFVPFSRAGLPRLESELRRLWDHTDHYRGLFFFGDEDIYGKMQEEHVEIAAACAARDASAAVMLMNRHRANALDGFRRRLISPADDDERTASL